MLDIAKLGSLLNLLPEAVEKKVETAVEARLEALLDGKVKAALEKLFGGGVDLSGLEAGIEKMMQPTAPQSEPEPQGEHTDGSFQVEHA